MLPEIKFFLGYAVAAILTFGHAAANHECYQEPNKLYVISCEESSIYNGAFSAFFWPFYWSWELFE